MIIRVYSVQRVRDVLGVHGEAPGEARSVTVHAMHEVLPQLVLVLQGKGCVLVEADDLAYLRAALIK